MFENRIFDKYTNLILLNTTQAEVLAAAQPDGNPTYVSPTVNGHTVIYPQAPSVAIPPTSTLDHWLDDQNKPLIDTRCYGYREEPPTDFWWELHYSNHHSLGLMNVLAGNAQHPWFYSSYFDRRRHKPARHFGINHFINSFSGTMRSVVGINIPRTALMRALVTQRTRVGIAWNGKPALDGVHRVLLTLYDLPLWSYRTDYRTIEAGIVPFGAVTLDGFRHVRLP